MRAASPFDHAPGKPVRSRQAGRSLLRVVSGGLTPIILLGALMAASAWMLRTSVVNKQRGEAAAQERSIATVLVQKGEFQLIVPVVGQLAAVDSKPAVVKVTGQIVQLVANGVEVKKGDVIAVLDVPRMLRRVRDQKRQYQQSLDDLERKKRDLAVEVQRATLRLEQARGLLEQFQAQKKVELAQARSQKDKDTADLELGQQRFERQKKLAEAGLKPGREVELAEAQLTAMRFALERETKQLELAEARSTAEELDKQAAVREAEAQLASAQSKQEAELANAQMVLQMNKAQLDRVQEEYSKAQVKSPGDGIVVMDQEGQGRGQSRPIQAGDRVWEGRTIATIADLSKMRVEVELDQEKARQVKLKQRAVITVDAVPGIAFDGKVSEISQTANESTVPGTGIPSGERTFQARIAIDNLKRAKLRPGMSAQARIIVQKFPKAVSVPLECVFDKEDRQVVYVRKGAKFALVEVELGPRNEDVVVIEKGLKGGEEVALRDVGDQGEAGAAPRSAQSARPVAPPGAGR